MKTIPQIDVELAELRADYEKEIKKSFKDFKESVVNKINRRIEFLEVIKKYLETDPTVDYLEREIAKNRRLLASAFENFEQWKKSNPQELQDKDEKQIQSRYKADTTLLCNFQRYAAI